MRSRLLGLALSVYVCAGEGFGDAAGWEPLPALEVPVQAAKATATRVADGVQEATSAGIPTLLSRLEALVSGIGTRASGSEKADQPSQSLSDAPSSPMRSPKLEGDGGDTVSIEEAHRQLLASPTPNSVGSAFMDILNVEIRLSSSIATHTTHSHTTHAAAQTSTTNALKEALVAKLGVRSRDVMVGKPLYSIAGQKQLATLAVTISAGSAAEKAQLLSTLGGMPSTSTYLGDSYQVMDVLELPTSDGPLVCKSAHSEDLKASLVELLSSFATHKQHELTLLEDLLVQAEHGHSSAFERLGEVLSAPQVATLSG